MRYAVAVAAIVIAAIALFGWGSKVRQLTRLSVGGWPLTIGLGLGGIIFLGGLGNLFGIARPWAFNAVILLGIGLSALELRTKSPAALSWRQAAAAAHWYHVVLIVIVAAVGGFVISTALPPAIFNHHDDFEKYFPQVARMLTTGTVHDNPIGSIGIETLGGQAVLQGFVAANFPIEYVNGADALFCLLLSLVIVGGVAFGHPALGLAILGGVLGVIAVDPQKVNISGIYSIVALSLTLVVASSQASESETDRPRIEPVVGLLYAAQIAVKLTAVSFVGLHFICWIGAIAWLCRDWRSALRRGLKTALWSGVFLSPWILLLAPDYIAIMAPPPGSPVLPKLPDHPPQFAYLFSVNSFLPMVRNSAVAAIVLCCGCAAFYHARWQPPRNPSRARAAAFAAFCVAAAANFVFYIAYVGPYLTDAEAATRYAAPWLIAGIGAALALGLVFLPGAHESTPSRKMAWTFGCGGLALIVMFGHALQRRISYAVLYATPPAYAQPWQPQARSVPAAMVADALHGKLPGAVRGAQNNVPAGSPILVWMLTPFLLDYGRNPIYEIGWYQLVRPWSLIPRTDYLIWQYGGFGVRQPQQYANFIRGGIPMLAQASVAALEFENLLRQIWSKSEVLSDSDGIVVLRVTCPRGIARC